MSDARFVCVVCGEAWAHWSRCPKCGGAHVMPVGTWHPTEEIKMAPWVGNARTIAAASVLQIHGGLDPDHSRDVADRVVFAVDRAGARGHLSAAPTDDEITRAASQLARLGVTLAPDEVRSVLDAAFIRGWGT